MYRSGHYGVALLAYAPVLYVLAAAGRVATAAVGLALVVSLTTLPDADHELPLVDHRGVTHTLLFAGLVGGAVGGGVWLAGDAGVLAFASAATAQLAVAAAALAAFAVLAHLLADALTPSGVALFWPVSSRRYSLGLASADSTLWNLGLFGAGVLATGGAALLASPVY
ncbi:metal-dependent hydrolase [Halobacterium yunchengense]|uniref:metal-dependent hydrolase n=1 Tax=Halobacterium yunchengense TaxID=3108497 RepID=UPI00300B4BAF